MTARKRPSERKKRGRKAGRELPGVAFDHDADVWVAVELRRRRGDKDFNACYALAADLSANTSGTLSDETIRTRYYRAKKRRKKEPGYAAMLDDWLNRLERSIGASDHAEPGVIIPIFLNRDPK